LLSLTPSHTTIVTVSTLILDTDSFGIWKTAGCVLMAPGGVRIAFSKTVY